MSNNSSPAIAPSPQSNGSTPGQQQGLAPRHIGSAPPVTKIVTSREWVLPPRPKPGRKPSADTPATKRKAQNRAAQRAFRERRATRVTELEERLGEVEKEKEINELNFKNVLSKLQNENKFLLKALNDIKADYSNFKQKVLSNNNNIVNSSQNSPAVYANGQVTAPSPLNYYKPSPNGSYSSPEGSVNQNYRFPQQYPQHVHRAQQHQGLRHNSIPQAPNSPLSQPHNNSHSHSHSHSKSPQEIQQFSQNNTPSTDKSSISSQNNDNFDCGVCVKDDCICAQVGIKPSPQPQQQQHEQQQPEPQQLFQSTQQSASIGSIQPMTPVSLKRKNENAEIDYTAKFQKKSNVGKKMPKLKKFKKVANRDDTDGKEFSTVFNRISDKDFESPMEQCGFCSDDSPCVCREAAKEAANAITELQNHSRRESQQQTQSTLPPISRHSSTAAVNKLPVLHPGPTVEIPEHHRSSISTPKEPAVAPVSEPKKENAGCTGNPGTCTQCQMDPMSTLFCTTIASKAEGEEENESENKEEKMGEPTVQKDELKNSPVSPPISTHSSKVSSPLTTSQEEELNSIIKKSGTSISQVTTPGGSSIISSTAGISASAKGIYIPCADAYKTLSRHKEFNSVDFSTLVGKLTTRGMQVEVQSVANVLRELDRRLYS